MKKTSPRNVSMDRCNIASRLRYIDQLAQNVGALTADARNKDSPQIAVAREELGWTLADARLRLDTLKTVREGRFDEAAVCVDAAVEEARAAFNRYLFMLASTSGRAGEKHE